MSNYTGRRGLPIGRLLIAAVVAGLALLAYFGSSQMNPVTGEKQYLDLTVQQEIMLGLQAAPEMAAQFGGLDPDQQAQALVDKIGNRIVERSPAGRSDYQFEFHLLQDPETVNAFALPGGQVFITRGLFNAMSTEGQLAGVLGHEAAHVIGRHSAEQIAKMRLTQGLTGAAVIAAYDPNHPSSAQVAQMAMLVGQLINLKYSRDDELEADQLGVCFMHDAGYNPELLIQVMNILEQSSQGQSPPEFLSTHPNPQNRIQRIQQDIQNLNQCPQ